MTDRRPKASTGGAQPEPDGAKTSPEPSLESVSTDPEEMDVVSSSVAAPGPPNPDRGGDSTTAELWAPGSTSEQTEATSSGDAGAPDSSKRSPKRSRRRRAAHRSQQPPDGLPDPATLPELLIAMVRVEEFRPTKRAVKSAKPTESISQEQVAAIHDAIADDPSFATPLAFFRAVLLSGPSKRAFEQAVTIVEECLRSRYRDRSSATHQRTWDQEETTEFTDWLRDLLVAGDDGSSESDLPESTNLVRALIVLLAARNRIQASDVPRLLTSTDGQRGATSATRTGPEDAGRALDALSFVSMLDGDPLTRRALAAAGAHIGDFSARAKQAQAENAALTQRHLAAEERARLLRDELFTLTESTRQLKVERGELTKSLAEAHEAIERLTLEVRDVTRALEDSRAREATMQELSEQRRIDDSNAYEALRAATSRSRRKDVELLEEAVAALSKEPPKPHVALDRVALVLKAMEREREDLRAEEGRAPDMDTDI